MTSPIGNEHTYRGNSEIHFFLDDQTGLSVTIDTERLHIRSIEKTEEECDRYAALFGDPNVMSKFANGETSSKENIKKRIDTIWTKRWREKDPYAGLAVFNERDDFVGHVSLGHSGRPGESELAYLFHRAHWEKKYGSEAITAVVKEYAPATVLEGYNLDGKPLATIAATARLDNPASSRILEKVGMHIIGTEEKYGALRRQYSMKLPQG